MGSKATALFFVFMTFTLNALPPICACGPCAQLHPRPPSHGGHRKKPHPYPHPPYSKQPPVVIPPIIINPPLLPPPVIYPPPSPPYDGGPPSGGGGAGCGGGGGGGGVPGHPSRQPTCPIDALKLGLCVDVVGGLVHVGIENPVQNICCPVIQGLLEIEAAICLCTVIRLKLLNLNIFVPLALQVLVTCGKTPPPGFVCPPL